MSLASHIPDLSLHHAYVIVGNPEVVGPMLLAHLEQLGHERIGNPDHREAVFDVFTVLDAHELARQAQLVPGAYGRKIFVYTVRTFSHDAQHALLKTIEEPPLGTHFFFLIRSSGMLIDTVRSRVQHIVINPDTQSKDAPFARQFLAAQPGARINMLLPWTKAKKEDKMESKEEVREFLRDLEMLLSSSHPRDEVATMHTLQDIVYAERELASTSPSVKLLLESIALLAPYRPLT